MIETPVLTRPTNSHHGRHRPKTCHPPSRKVISIPVLEKSKKNKTAAARKIQKAFRRYLARKRVKKIIDINTQVDEMEKRLSQKETFDTMKTDHKELLKVNEMLMAVLFQLDSVRGIGAGVRELRKAVIKKVIALQEKVDELAAKYKVSDEAGKDESLQAQSERFGIKPAPEDVVTEVLSEKIDNFHINQGQDGELDGKQGEEWKEMRSMEQRKVGDEISNELSSTVERMVGKNEKLMDVVMELREQNEWQTKLISSLTQRVAKLEVAAEKQE